VTGWSTGCAAAGYDQRGAGGRVDGIAGLRAQLEDMRASLIERLVCRIEGGSLALLGSVGTALDALGCRSGRPYRRPAPWSATMGGSSG
jgi:hypothetical protein